MAKVLRLPARQRRAGDEDAARLKFQEGIAEPSHEGGEFDAGIETTLLLGHEADAAHYAVSIGCRPKEGIVGRKEELPFLF